MSLVGVSTPGGSSQVYAMTLRDEYERQTGRESNELLAGGKLKTAVDWIATQPEPRRAMNTILTQWGLQPLPLMAPAPAPAPAPTAEAEIQLEDLGSLPAPITVAPLAVPRISSTLAQAPAPTAVAAPTSAAATPPPAPCPAGQYRTSGGACAVIATMDQARQAQQQVADYHAYTQAATAAAAGEDEMSIWGTLVDIGGELLQGATGIDLSPIGIGFDGGGATLPGGAPAPAPAPIPTSFPTSFPTTGFTATGGGPCPVDYPISVAGQCLSASGAVWLPGGAPAMIPAPAPAPTQPAQPVMTAAAGCPSGFHPNKTSYWTRSGFVPRGTRCVRNRRRNALNPRAAARAMARLKAAKKAAKTLNRVTIREKC